MSSEPKTKPPVPWGLISVILLLVVIGAYFMKSVLSDQGPREESHITPVTLVKPPVKPLLKPPAPIPARQTPARIERVIKEEMNQDMEMEADAPQDAMAQSVAPEGDSQGDGGGDISGPPAGDTLGMDAEGGAGGDSFGLVGRKGGRSILAKSGGGPRRAAIKVPLMVRFSEYIQIVTAEIKMRVTKRLDEEGGIPKGKLQCTVRLSVDKDGQIIDYRITKSSGNTKMDRAIISVLHSCRFSEPPPQEMPKKIDILITSQG